MSEDTRYSISFSQFVRYWNAETSTKKRTVVKSLLDPVFGAPYYHDFNSAIKNFVSDNQTNDEILLGKIEHLMKIQPSKESNLTEYTRIQNNIDVIQKALEIIPFKFPKNFRLLSLPRQSKILLPETNLRITVAPDFVFSYNYRNNKCIGAFKLFYTKDLLNTSNAQMLATLLREFLNQNYATQGLIRFQQCQIINLNTKEYTIAPSANYHRLEQIAEDCRNIYSTLLRLA